MAMVASLLGIEFLLFLPWSRLHSFKQFSLPNIFKGFRFEDWHNTFPSFRYTYNSAKNTPLCELFIFSRMVSSLALSQIESEREAPFCTLRSCVNTLVWGRYNVKLTFSLPGTFTKDRINGLLLFYKQLEKTYYRGSVEWQKNNRVNCHVLPPYFFPMQFRQNIRQCHHLSLLFVFNSRRRSAKKKTWKYRFRLSNTYRNSQLVFNDWKLRNWNALKADFVLNSASRFQISKQKMSAKLAHFSNRWTLCVV